MMATIRIRPVAVILLLAVVLVGAGCKKQRANLNQKKLADMVNTLKGHEAGKYQPQQFEQVQGQLQSVQQQIEGQQFDQAFEGSRTALDDAEALLEEVKRLRAADLKNRVVADIRIAQDNGGPSLEPERFARIQELQAEGDERFEKNDWDGAIENYVEASQEVDSLLAPVRQAAMDSLERIRGRVLEMEAEQVREYAPTLGVQVDQSLRQAEQLIDPQRQFTTAQTVLQATNQYIDEAIEAAKEVRSQIILTYLEDNLYLALSKGAFVFFPERTQDAAQTYENMLRDFEGRRFDNVLQAGDLLRPKVDTLRYDTAQRSAQTKIQSLETIIDNLSRGGAREFLPGRVESLEALLEDAREQWETGTEQGFEEAEEITRAADVEYELILADFNELANRAIAEANQELEVAAGVFRATDEIFDIEIPGRETTELERQMERTKQALKAELRTLLDAARATLGEAQLHRDSQQYQEAIRKSEDVVQTAQDIQRETYSVAAHNSILEVQGALSYYAAQGGSQYAPQQVAEVRGILAEAREALEADQPKQAVDTAALAKAELDVLRQTLAEQGARNVLEAEQAIREAVDAHALEYASGRMEEARDRLETALASRDLLDYKDVIESAANAAAIAEAAQTYSRRQFAQAQIAQAADRLEFATRSDAALYAPRLFKEATDKIAAARDMVGGDNLQEAATLATEAAELAMQAAYERVIEAEQEIENARHYEAWQYSSRTLAEAINAAKEARRLADLGNFDLARAFADESIEMAKAATISSKGSDVALRLSGLSQDVQAGMHSGANYFQGDQVKEILTRMAQLQATYTPDNYDEVDTQLRELEARLAEVLINTPAVLERAVLQQGARRQAFLDSPVEIEIFAGDELEKSEALLRYAKIDFDKGMYAQSYQNLRKAILLLNEVETILANSNYNAAIAELFADFVEAQDDFRHILSMSEAALITFVVTTTTEQPQVTAIAGEASPNEFRDAIEDLYKRAKALEPPPSKKLTHESVVELFELALRSAQNFEKLVILDQFDKKTAREMISTAYEQLRRARSMQQDIERTFREPRTDSLIVKKRQIAGIELY